jgi:hypothetical protein
MHADPHVDDRGALRRDDDRVAVQLGDRGIVIREGADRAQDVLERRQVGGRRASVAGEQRDVASARGISCTSRSLSGARRIDASASSSATVPPAAHATTGPNRWSWVTPTSSSTPAFAIGWRRKPAGARPAPRRSRCIARAARRTAARPRSASRTAPTSVLCSGPGPTAFSATAPPNAAAASAASAGVLAIRPQTFGSS